MFDNTLRTEVVFSFLGVSVERTKKIPKNKAGQRTQKQDGAQHAFSKNKQKGVCSCALHEIDIRSLLKHRAH